MRLAVNIDHFATLREARADREPEPVLAALLAEQAGAVGIVCHIRSDRRHIKERDLHLLRQTIKTRLIVEMAATEEMKKIAFDVMPDIVSLVPEKPDELTTEGGLDVLSHRETLGPHIRQLQEKGIQVSIFVNPDKAQIGACQELGCDMIEINTGTYADSKSGEERDKALAAVISAADFGHGLGLRIHGGHGLDYKNINPIASIPQFEEFSIGFAIVARAAIVGIEAAVREMAFLVE